MRTIYRQCFSSAEIPDAVPAGGTRRKIVNLEHAINPSNFNRQLPTNALSGY